MNNNFKLLLPSVADAIFLSIFLRLSFAPKSFLLNDGDTGYHIRAGEFILDTLSVPKQDIFSHISPPLSWVAHEWLSEVLMALAHKRLGLTGIVVLFSFLIASVYFLLFRTIQKNKGNIILATGLISLVIPSSQLHWLARPHIFSLLLTVIWYHVLDSYQYKEKNYLYVLPPLMLLWVNLHGGFVFGFMLLGVYVVGNAIILLTSGRDKKPPARKFHLLVITGIASLVASLVNPYGYQILLFPFELTSNQLLVDRIGEYLSPDFHGFVPFRYLLFLTIGLFSISKTRLNLVELILMIGLTHMALYSARYIPLFAIIVMPILLRQAESIVDSAQGTWADFFRRRSDAIARLDASSKWHLWPTLAVLMTSFVIIQGKIEYQFDEKSKPIRAVEFLKKENIKGNMFNNDEFGDFIIYAAWPQYKVFIDGRLDMYGSSHLDDYFKVTSVKRDWERVIERYDVRWIIYDANSALSTFLTQRNEWRLVYADKVANIFVKNIPENLALIKKYSHVKVVVEK